MSKEGESWTASWPASQQLPSRRAVSPPTTPKGTKEVTVSLKLKRISHVHRAVAAACDAKGKGFSENSQYILLFTSVLPLAETCGPLRILFYIALILFSVFVC